MRMQIQLDALGGVAGDMFVAAMLDAFPDWEAGVLASITGPIVVVGHSYGGAVITDAAYQRDWLSAPGLSSGGASRVARQGHGSTTRCRFVVCQAE